MDSLVFVDSHCHLDFREYADDRETILARAKAAGVRYMVNICTKPEELPQILATADAFPHIFATIGVHPHDAEEAKSLMPVPELVDWLAKGLQHPKVIGIGETGLDYYYDHSPRAQQREIFQAHIDVNIRSGVPLCIHTRDAETETIELLQAAQGKATGLIHCFSGTSWLAKEALDLGFYISISGIATFQKAEEIREVVKFVPLDRLLLETDAPFLAPVPYRGKRNEPSFLVETAKVVAELKQMPIADLARQTTQNFFTLFQKAKPLSGEA